MLQSKRTRPVTKTKRQGRALAPEKYNAEPLEERMLLAAIVAAPDSVIFADNVSGPLAPKPGHSFYVSGSNSQGVALSQWANASAIIPNVTNDLILNVAPSLTNYSACCEAAGGTLGASVLTNGITQTQTAPPPSPNQPAIGDGGASDQSNNTNVAVSVAGPLPFFIYNLGTAGGANPNAKGYDLSEIDVITGHQDENEEIFSMDILVESVGSSHFLSLSGSRGFSLTTVPNGSGGVTYIGKGASQMAIVSDTAGEPIAQNIRAVEFLINDPTTFFREFVVTGTPSTSLSASAPSAPGVVVTSTASGGVNVLWPASTGAVGYTVFRSSTASGGYQPVGSVVGQTSFSDGTAQPNTTYYYAVMASGNGDSGISSPSTAATATDFGATAYLYPNQYWQGTPSIVENLPQINYRGGQQASSFPFAQGFNANSFSAFIAGKVTTDLEGMYTFLANTDDDGYLWVNGQLVSEFPGSHSQQDPITTIPISLAANTAYDFVFLENQTGGNWGFSMFWQEPTADGTPDPVTLVPTTSLRSSVDTPPVPSHPSVAVNSPTSVRINWNPVGDTSSYGYLVQRANCDADGNLTSAWETVGEVFSGPTSPGAPGPQAWGASSIVDGSGAAAGQLNVYRVGALLPGQTVPAAFSPVSQIVSAPVTATASLSGRTLNVTLSDANDDLSVQVDPNSQLVIDISSTTIFSAPVSSVDSLNIVGSSTGYSSVTTSGTLDFPGSLTASGVTAVYVYGPISAGQLSIQATSGIRLNSSLSVAGTITLDADSNADSSGTLSVAAGAAVDSGGSPIFIHAAGLALNGIINSGTGDVLYSVWPLVLGTGIFSNTVSSGTVTVVQTTVPTLELSATTGPLITGKLVLDFPNASFLTNGLDTSAGNAALQIVASSLVSYGPVDTGSASFALDAQSVTIGAAVTAGSLSIPSYGAVAVDGATVTVAGTIANAGSILVGEGGTVSADVALSGQGSVTVGPPVGSGTVAYYRFEGVPGVPASGTDTIVDTSGNGLNGTPVNSPAYSAAVPAGALPQTGTPDTSSLGFNGTNQYVSIPDYPGLQLTKSLTLEAYIDPQPLTSGNPDGNIIFRGDYRAGYDPYWLRFIGTNAVGFNVTNAAGQSTELTATVPLGQWVHVAGTLDDSTGLMCLYVNGGLAASTITNVRPLGPLLSPGGLGIGALGYGGEYFNGLIDEVRISNVALTPSQFLDAPQRPLTAGLNVGSIAESAVSIGSTGMLSISNNATPSTSTMESLNITPGGRLDLSNNVLVINYSGQSDPIVAVRGYLAAGYNGGAWNGAGIVSSVAAVDASHATTIGYADSADGTIPSQPADSIEIRDTLVGDANLDGSVNLADLLLLIRHFGQGGSWDQGDFNYDGSVNVSDFLSLTRNFGRTLVTDPVIASVMQQSSVPTAARRAR